jgi:glycosyltransferase involved in cell wall biosynthesis
MAYARRLATLLRARRYDALWIYLELFPYWPGLFERLASYPGIPIILDYDDAIFRQYDSSPNAAVRRLLGAKLAPLLKAADAICCGNPYLEDYAAQFSNRTMLLPTVVDTDRYTPAVKRRSDRVVVGWIGSPTTWPNVRPLLPLLQSLVAEHGIAVRIVGAGKAADRDRFEGLELLEWAENSEIDEVQRMDIGIMPLDDSPFQRGKCGYKLIQYMACGVPVIASPVGVNAQIVRDGRNGFLASSEDEWRAALAKLIGSSSLRSTLGSQGRQIAVEEYSLAVHAQRLVGLMRDVIGRNR